jgi:hypothetical protein
MRGSNHSDKTPQLNNPTAGEFVLEVHRHDVLFGRGSGPNDNEGNIRFRDLVAQRKSEYMATNHRQTKAKIAKEIVDQVFLCGGRFLKKIEPAEAASLGLPDTCGRDVYQVVGDDTVMEKAKQALRQNRNREDSTSPKPTSRVRPGVAAIVPPVATSVSPDLQVVPSSGDYGFGGPGGAVAHQPVSSMHHQPQEHRHFVNAFDSDGFAQPENRVRPSVESDQHHDQYSNNSNPPMHNVDQYAYATYTMTLDDPEEEHPYFPGSGGGGDVSTGFNRRSFMDVASATGTSSRRTSLLGGRKPDNMISTNMNNVTAATVTTTTTTGPAGNLSGMNATSGRRESLQLHEIWRRQSLVGSKGDNMQSQSM